MITIPLSSRSSTAAAFMPGQLQGIEQSGQRWKELMSKWQPFQAGLEEAIGYKPTEYEMRDIGKIQDLLKGGGYTGAERAVQAAMMPYATGQMTFADIPGMGQTAQRYMQALTGKAEADLGQAERDLAYKMAAKGKFGSGGHIASLQDLYSQHAQGLTQMGQQLSQETLGQMRTAGMQEAGTQQSLAKMMSDIYGAGGQMQRLGALQQAATMPRQYELQNIQGQQQLWQQNLSDILRNLGYGVGIGTGGVGTVAGSGWGQPNPYTTAANLASQIGQMALSGYLGGTFGQNSMASSGYSAVPSSWSGSYGIPGLGYYGYGF